MEVDTPELWLEFIDKNSAPYIVNKIFLLES